MTLSHCLILARSFVPAHELNNDIVPLLDSRQVICVLKDTGACGDWSLVTILLYAAARGQQSACDQDLQESLAVSAVVEFVACDVQPLGDGIEVGRGLGYVLLVLGLFKTLNDRVAES